MEITGTNVKRQKFKGTAELPSFCLHTLKKVHCRADFVGLCGDAGAEQGDNTDVDGDCWTRQHSGLWSWLTCVPVSLCGNCFGS